jgi:hypothetical protein
MDLHRRDLLRFAPLGAALALPIPATPQQRAPRQTMSRSVLGAVDATARGMMDTYLAGASTQAVQNSAMMLYATMTTLFAEMEETGVNDILPGLLEQALTQDPSLLNPSDAQILAAVGGQTTAIPPRTGQPGTFGSLAWSDVAPMFTPDGFRQAQQTFLESMWHVLQNPPVAQPAMLRWPAGRVWVSGVDGPGFSLLCIDDPVPVTKPQAEMMLKIGAAFATVGAAAFAVLGGAAVPAAVTTGVILVGIGGGFVVAGAAVWLIYEMNQKDPATPAVPSILHDH